MIFCPERDTTEERRQQLAALTETPKPAPRPVSWFSLAARTI